MNRPDLVAMREGLLAHERVLSLASLQAETAAACALYETCALSLASSVRTLAWAQALLEVSRMDGPA